MKTLLRIALICPCKVEYDKCKLILKLVTETNLNGRTICAKKDNNFEIFAIFAGPGKIQCASATQLVIDKFSPDFIVDVGGAGALSDEFQCNDIIIAKEVYEFDICELTDYVNLKDELTSKTIFQYTTDYSIEHFKILIKEIESLVNVRVKFGNIASGEKTIADKNLRDNICTALNAQACNWETSSVIKTANLNKVKGLSIRVITDNADKEMRSDFYNNWGNSLEKLFQVLNYIIEKFDLDYLINNIDINI